MHMGIPTEHRRFWSLLTTDELYAIYQGMAVSAKRIANSFSSQSTPAPMKKEFTVIYYSV